MQNIKKVVVHFAVIKQQRNLAASIDRATSSLEGHSHHGNLSRSGCRQLSDAVFRTTFTKETPSL